MKDEVEEASPDPSQMPRLDPVNFGGDTYIVLRLLCLVEAIRCKLRCDLEVLFPPLAFVRCLLTLLNMS